MPSVLVVLAVKALIAFRGVATHVIWPFKEQLVLDLLQNLMYWFSEHRINHLSISGPRLPSIVSPGLIIVVSVQPEIPPLLKDNLSLPLPLPLLLVFLDLIILINSVHKLAYTDSRYASLFSTLLYSTPSFLFNPNKPLWSRCMQRLPHNKWIL